MPKRELPSPELLRKLLRYEPETGKLFWRKRPPDMFPRESRGLSWNTRYAGAEAFKDKHERGYKRGSIFGKTFRAHRAIWAMVHGHWPPEDVDHINGDTSDNRLENLRAVSRQENLKNQRLSKTNRDRDWET